MSRPGCSLEPFTGNFSFSLFFFLSWAIPQFGLLSHVSSLRLSSGHSGLILTLSNAACTSLFSPRLLVADAILWPASPLGVAVKCILFCGCFLFCFVFLRVMLPSEIPKLPQTLLWEGFLLFGNFSSFKTPSPGQVSVPLFSIFLSFIFCPISFWREWAAFPGAWCPPPAFRNCFVEAAQHSNDLLKNLWGRK